MKSIEQCRKGYHDYRVMESNRVIISKCEICGKVIQENPQDNKTYLENHKRDFVQRGQKEFEWLHGKPKSFTENQDKLKESKESELEAKEEWRRKKRDSSIHQTFTEEDYNRNW